MEKKLVLSKPNECLACNGEITEVKRCGQEILVLWNCPLCGIDYVKAPAEMLDLCRYYGKESKRSRLFANYERLWIEYSLGIRSEEHTARHNKIVAKYNSLGLDDFNKEDNTPIGIKAILYNRYMHWACWNPSGERPNGFKSWYKKKYLETETQL